jgi:hypothetical protein
VGLESFRAGVQFVQHDRIGLFLWQQDLKLQRSGLGGEAAFAMSFQKRQVFISLAGEPS